MKVKSASSSNKRPQGPLSLTWVQSTLQKFDFGMEPKTTTLHPTCFKITAMQSVCCYNLLGWRSFWNVPPSLMNWPGWQFLFTFPPVFPIGPKNTNLVEGVNILLPVKYPWIPFSGFREEVENVKVYGRTPDGRTDDGRCAMTIAHLSLRLRWAKNTTNQNSFHM